jgi:hypothetical protein
MIAFLMVLGSAAGIKIAQSIWQFLGWSTGSVSIAVPIGGVIGAAGGVVLGRISNPRVLVLLMAIFAGWSAGGVAGKIAWGETGEICGQVAIGLLGGLAWATWFFVGGGRNRSV